MLEEIYQLDAVLRKQDCLLRVEVVGSSSNLILVCTKIRAFSNEIGYWICHGRVDTTGALPAFIAVASKDHLPEGHQSTVLGTSH